MRMPSSRARSSRSILVRLDWALEQRARLDRVFSSDHLIHVARHDHGAIADALETCEIAIIDGVADERYLLAPNLKWLHCDQSGLDGFAPRALADSDLVVTSSKGRSGPVLAEHAIHFMLSLAYRAPDMMRAQRRRVWGIRAQADLRGLHGKTVCIVGYGATGENLARQCLAFGMKVSAFRRKDQPTDLPGVRMYSAARGDCLIDAIRGADIVALCASLNDSSYHILGEPELAAMKPGGHLVNVARAQLVDEGAMIGALRSGHLAGAGLDVTDPFEPLPPWHRLWSVPNLILTPHVTPQMPDRTGRTLDILAENYRRYQAGDPLLHQFAAEDVFSRAPKPAGFRGRHRLMTAWAAIGRRLS